MVERPLFTLDDFEGPLDLLLHLISEHKLDILNIRITDLLRQYTDYLDKVREQDLEIASEFIEMAARLVRIKTNLMLPRTAQEGEEELGQLTAEIIEYSLCQQIARMLTDRNSGIKMRVREQLKLPSVRHIYEREHDPNELASAYFYATKRGKNKQPPPKEAFDGIVNRPFVSVASRAVLLLRSLYKKGRLPLDSLYNEAQNRSQLVATFLAVLELVRRKRIYISEDGSQVEITEAAINSTHAERSAENGDK